MGQKPVRGSRIVTGERWLGEFCDQIFVTVTMTDAAAARDCGDLADFEGQLADGFGRRWRSAAWRVGNQENSGG